MLKTSAFEHVQNRICLLLPVYAPLPSATVTPRSISSPMRFATLSPLYSAGRSRRHLSVVGNAEFFRNFPILKVVEHADHQCVCDDNAGRGGL